MARVPKRTDRNASSRKSANSRRAKAKAIKPDAEPIGQTDEPEANPSILARVQRLCRKLRKLSGKSLGIPTGYSPEGWTDDFLLPATTDLTLRDLVRPILEAAGGPVRFHFNLHAGDRFITSGFRCGNHVSRHEHLHDGSARVRWIPYMEAGDALEALVDLIRAVHTQAANAADESTRLVWKHLDETVVDLLDCVFVADWNWHDFSFHRDRITERTVERLADNDPNGVTTLDAAREAAPSSNALNLPASCSLVVAANGEWLVALTNLERAAERVFEAEAAPAPTGDGNDQTEQGKPGPKAVAMSYDKKLLEAWDSGEHATKELLDEEFQRQGITNTKGEAKGRLETLLRRRRRSQERQRKNDL